jgi:V-type H+-transporting ATPase subunit a
LKLNAFTAPFQEIVNTYGVPRYQEINPGLFTIATFPFLFAVMFGDIGHGFLLLLLGLYLVYFPSYIEQSKSLLAPLIPVRYLFLMMGAFAFYIGWIYNDFMSIAFNVFGSCYELSEDVW